MPNLDAHQALLVSAASRIANPVISYMRADGAASHGSGLMLKAYGTDFRNSPEATRRTFELMSRLVWQSIGDASIVRAADTIRQQAERYNELLAEALFRWVRSTVRYKADEELVEQGNDGRELLIAPALLLKMDPKQGDCDDFSMLTAALAISLGLRAKFVAVALDVQFPWRYSHVFAQVEEYIPELGRKEWISLDCSHGPRANWETDGQILRYESFV